MSTKTGKAIRAVSQSPRTASLMGISVNSMISITFILGSSLAGIGAVLVGLKYPKIEPLMGMMIGMKAFVAAVLGGIGNLPGAVLGGLLMGVCEEMVVGYLSSTYRDALAFGLLILVLLFKPSGLLGQSRVEKGMKTALVLPFAIAALATLSVERLPVQLIILFIAGINIILATSLNLVNGFCGQFSLGHAGFMALGGYTSAALSLAFHPFDGPLYFLNFLIYALAGGAVAGVGGFLVGLPSLRLKGDYLAIVTLGFGEIIRVIFLNAESLGGARGMYGIAGPRPIDIFGLHLSTFFVSCTIAYFWACMTFLVLWRWTHSSYGRVFLSVREDEMAAECMGVNTTRTKVLAFVISSFLAGLAGSLYAHINNYLSPASFQFTRSVDVVIMVVLGGMGSLSGSVIGAIVVTLLPEVLRPLHELTGIDLRMVIYSLLLILLMILRPQGLMGSRELSDIWRRYARRRT